MAQNPDRTIGLALSPALVGGNGLRSTGRLQLQLMVLNILLKRLRSRDDSLLDLQGSREDAVRRNVPAWSDYAIVRG